MLSSIPSLAILLLISFVDANPASVCNSGIYKLLTPLGTDPDVRQFCLAKYPPSAVKRGEEEYHLVKRGTTTAKITTTPSPSTTAKPSTTISICKSCSKLSSLKNNAESIIRTACSCILKPSTTSKGAATTKSMTTPSATPSTTTTTSSSQPAPTTCNADQSNFCNSQTQNVCRCQLDLDGVNPVCSNGAACPQTKFPNPPPPCASDADCVLQFPGSTYNRCVYTDADFFCTPTYCATEDGCFQQGRITQRRSIPLAGSVAELD